MLAQLLMHVLLTHVPAALTPYPLWRVVPFPCHAVQYTPFTFPSLRNPCVTLLGRTTNQPGLQLTFRQASAGMTETPKRWYLVQLQLLALQLLQMLGVQLLGIRPQQCTMP
jgi:hypothetical protein